MKYHKINNIPLETCTAEQKIAYNLAFAHYDLFLKEYNRMPTGHARAEVIHHAARKMIEWYKGGYSYTNKYNIDLIFSALLAGLENYFNTKYKILSSYKEIGKIFPANYLK